MRSHLMQTSFLYLPCQFIVICIKDTDDEDDDLADFKSPKKKQMV